MGASFDRYACDWVDATVLPDVNGCWNVECRNGDRGWASFAGWRPRVWRKYPAHAGAILEASSRVLRRKVHGKSAMENKAKAFSCAGAAEIAPVVPDLALSMCGPHPNGTSFPERHDASGFTCESGGCDGTHFSTCGRSAPEEPSPTFIRGPSALDDSDCKVTRGGSCEQMPGFSCAPYFKGEPNPPTPGLCTREFLGRACDRFGKTCPVAYAGSGPQFETALACICEREGPLRKCCADAKTAVGTKSWSTTAPVVSEYIGSTSSTAEPVFCSMALLNCNLRSDAQEREACTKIANDLEACNAQVCSIADWSKHVDTCESEAGP
jgi:hypothetical protein